MCLFVFHIVFAGINCQLFHALFDGDISYQIKKTAEAVYIYVRI